MQKRLNFVPLCYKDCNINNLTASVTGGDRTWNYSRLQYNAVVSISDYATGGPGGPRFDTHPQHEPYSNQYVENYKFDR